MISTLEKEITLRFLKARKNDGFLNVISIFSFIGISLGVAVLIVVMSVMNGFRTELINKIVGFNSHITVKSYDNSINLDKLNNNNLKLISKQIILSNSGEAIVLKNNTSKGIILRGYLGSDFSKLEIIKNKNFKGNRSKLNKNSISIGNELSFSLNLKIGDDITLMSPSGVETIIGSMPKQKTFTVTSIFNSGLADVPIITPIRKKIFTIDLFNTPIDLRIAMSLVLFLTNMVNPEIILKAATIIINDKMINITFRSTFNAENKELFISAQL